MKKLLAFIFLTSLVVYAGLPPTSLKGGNEASPQTTFQFNLGQIPVTRTGTNVTFGTIPVTQGGTSATSLTQYSLMSGNGTGAVNMIAPAASGTLLFSNGASAFPSYRLLASSDVITALGYTPSASGAPWATSGTSIYYNAGNVGIGTANPGSTLDVGSSGFSGGVANFGNGGASLSNYVQINNRALFGFNSSSSNAVVQGISGRGIEFNVNNNTFGAGTAAIITSAGNVGINNTSPKSRLDVIGNINITNVSGGSSNTVSGFYGWNSSNNHLFSLTRQNGINNADVSLSGFGGVGLMGGRTLDPASTGYHLYVNPTGNVGIGTTSQTALLDVNGSARIRSLTSGLVSADASGTLSSITSTTSGAVLSLDESGETNWLYPETNSIVNYASNPSFEQSTTGWVASGSVSLLNYDRSGNGVPYLKGDKKYLAINTGSTNAGACSTQTVPQNMRGTTVEISTQYRNGFDASGTWVMQATVGSQVVSQTIALDPASSTTPYSDSFLDSPKMFVGTTSSTATVQLCLLRSSGTAWLHVDNVWVGSPRSLANGAIVGPWQAYTPTYTGFGTVTASEVFWRQNGSSIEISAKFTAGTTTATEARFSLPNNYIAASTNIIPTIRTAGLFYRGAASLNTMNVLMEPDVAYITFSSNTAGTNPLTKAVGSNVLANGETATFFASVPIKGLNGTGVTYESRCPNDISCTNEFSAKISGTTVTSENLDWISSVGLTDTSLYTITFNSGVFTDAPNCVANASRVGIPSTTMSIESVTSSTVAVRGRGDTGALQATDFFVQCNKSTDYVAKKTIQGYLSQTVTTSGQTLEYTVRARFGGAATETTVCSSTPCTIYRQSGGISSITRSATGQYQIVFPSGTFSAPPSCFFTVGNGTNVLTVIETVSTPPTSTTFNFNPSTVAAAAADVYGSVVCTGPR